MPAGAARTAAENQVNGRAQAYQTKATSAEQELARLDQNVQSTRAHIMDQISDRMDPIIVEVMRARSASIAVDKGVTIAISPALDVTNDVLARFNSAVTSLSVTPLPQQAAPATQQPAPGR
jgi:outer membrane protein